MRRDDPLPPRPSRPLLFVVVAVSLVGAVWPAGRRSPESDPRSCSETPDTATLPGTAASPGQSLQRLGVDRWHASGVRGAGVRVAILDSGFRGYRTFLGRALPARVRTHSFRADGNLEAKDSQHGIWCAAVIHTIAPDAELLLANWEPDHPDQFLEAVRWVKQEGAKVISCSVIMPSWSDGEGGGDVDDALDHILGDGARPGDVLCFASAGNIAQRHWSGVFHGDGDGYHLWRPGQRDDILSPWGGGRVAVELCWQPGSEYEVTILDFHSGRQVAHSPTRSRQSSCAVASFDPEEGHRYRVRVRLRHGVGGAFHLSALGGGLEIATANGSIPCPADAAAVVAVGAVDEDNHRATYSSCGPNSRRPKPDLVAPVPFQGCWRARPFSGTSAAAPQAAALAALWESRQPNWTARQVRQAMCSTARDLGPPGHDWETGYGLITLPNPTVTLTAGK